MKLLPCPFCGTGHTLIATNGRGGFWARCCKCGADMTTSDTRKGAAAKWNKRTTKSPWISTLDKLPEENQEVLAVFLNNPVFISVFKLGMFSYNGALSMKTSYWRPISARPEDVK